MKVQWNGSPSPNPSSRARQIQHEGPHYMGFPGTSGGKESACNVGDWVQSLGWEDPLEKGMASHSSILSWRIPMDRGALWATVHGVAKSRTRLSD